MINVLNEYCEEMVDEFSKHFSALDVEKYEDKKYTVWTVVLKLLRIDFVYIKNECKTCPKSTLFTRIYLNKNDSMFYHIYELLEYIDETDFKCYYFSYIESKERMKACFDVFLDFYEKHFDRLKELAMDSETGRIIREKKFKEMEQILKPGPDDRERFFSDDISGIYEYNVLLFKYTRFLAYTQYLEGNYKKSLGLYNRLFANNNGSDYEKRLAKHMESLGENQYNAIYKECASMLEVRDYNGNKKDGITYLKNIAICYVFFAVIFLVVELLLKGFLNKGAIYSTVAPVGVAFTTAVIPGLFGGIAFRRKLAHFTRKEDVKKALAFDRLMNGRKTNIFAVTAFVVFLILSIGFHIWLPFISVRFYENRLEYNGGERFMYFGATSKAYDEIEAVVYVEGRLNIYGDYIDRGSYVIVFKDGTKLDLDGFTTVDKTKDKILAVLKIKEEEIKKLRIIEELEQ